MKWFKRILLLVGIGILIYLINAIGWDKLWDSLQRIGWWGLPLLTISLFWNVLHTMAWQRILKFMGHSVPLFKLYQLKLIAEAVNTVAPSANLGGDTLRAYLIKTDVPLSDGLPSVVIDKTLDYITKMLFNMGGLGIALFFIEIPQNILMGCVVYLAIIFVLNGLWVWVQIRGLSGGVLKLTQWIPPLRKFLDSKREQMATLDKNLQKSYTQGLSSLIFAGTCHTIARFFGVLEVVVIMNLLGAPISYVEALFFIAFINVVNGVFFLIPGQLGASEWAQQYILEKLNYPLAPSLGLAVVRRIRKYILTGIGFIFLMFYGRENIPTELEEPV